MQTLITISSISSLFLNSCYVFLVRVMFGTSHLYVFHHPAEVESSSVKQADITYEMAQEEIAKNAGLDVDDQEESKGDSTFFLYLELYR